jgi:hypothetical protein
MRNRNNPSRLACRTATTNHNFAGYSRYLATPVFHEKWSIWLTGALQVLK